MAKKKKGTRFEIEDVELSMTPMIDIVFNLLIFFMCATKFRTPEGMIEAFLPKDKGQASGTPQIDLNEIRIQLLWHDRGGRPITADTGGFVVLKINDQVFNNPGELEDTGHPETAPMWRELFGKLEELKGAYKGSSDAGMPVKLDARAQVPTKFVISALNEVVRAGLSDVTFAAPEIDY